MEALNKSQKVEQQVAFQTSGFTTGSRVLQDGYCTLVSSIPKAQLVLETTGLH